MITMKEIKELAFVINQDELKSTIKSLRNIYDDSKLASLFNGIIEDEFNDDRDAIAELYPNTRKTSSYRKLKSTLKKRLKDAVLISSEVSTGYSDYQKAYYQCYKQWAIVKILLGKNAREAAIDIANHIFNKAIIYEFTRGNSRHSQANVQTHRADERRQS